jgi:chorismate mutase/prephenate dehydratase
MSKLPGLRRRIDKVDDQILVLLNQRAKLVQSVYKEKQALARVHGGQVEAFVPGREVEILRRLSAKNAGPFPAEGIAPVFREVISACRSLEISPRIAFFGQPGSNTHQASLNVFGSQAEHSAQVNIPSVFEEVEQGRADYGVVPVENSTEGAINHTLDLFVDSELKVCSELSLPIRHLLLNRGGKLAGVKRVLSHPQALAQCRRWLAKNLPGVSVESAASTSEAAKQAAKDRTGRTAAIASQLAVELYGLKVAARNIQDQNDNTTRFFVIGRARSKPTGKDKTSVMLSIRDKVGALSSVLKPFERHKVNLTSIESRPSRRKAWDYYFFVDFQGHQDEPKVQRLLQDLGSEVAQLKVLGSYPAA